jgi:hypothetical protein
MLDLASVIQVIHLKLYSFVWYLVILIFCLYGDTFISLNFVDVDRVELILGIGEMTFENLELLFRLLASEPSKCILCNPRMQLIRVGL